MRFVLSNVFVTTLFQINEMTCRLINYWLWLVFWFRIRSLAYLPAFIQRQVPMNVILSLYHSKNIGRLSLALFEFLFALKVSGYRMDDWRHHVGQVFVGTLHFIHISFYPKLLLTLFVREIYCPNVNVLMLLLTFSRLLVSKLI